MDFFKAFVIIFITCVCHILGYSVASREGIQLKLLRQEYAPSIEYKYVVKTIVPADDRWWKRGTHRFYAEESAPKVIEA